MRRLFTIFFCLFVLNSFSQNDQKDIYDLNFDELSKLKVISVSKTEQNANEVPTTVRIITGDEIMARGYLTFDEMLSDLPGFQFRNIQSLNSYVFQRGIPNQNNLILILIDGVQINELNSGGFYGGAQYDLSSIDRVEVVYGPSSVTYGTNAISGVINIITKSAVKNGGELRALAGNFNTYNSSFDYNYLNADQQFRARVSGMVKFSDKANLRGVNGDNNWDDLLDIEEDDYNLGIKIAYKNLTFGTNYMNKQSALGTYQKATGTAFKDFGTNWNIQFLNNYLRYHKDISEKLNWSSIVYNRNATVLKNTVYRVTDTSQVGYYRPNNLTGIENVLNYKFNSSVAVTGGVVLEYEKLAEKAVLTQSNSMYLAPPEPGEPNFQKNFLASAFLEPRITIGKHLYLSGGGRFDYSTIYDKVFTPRAGINFIQNNFSSMLAYAEAFRAPKPWDYTDGAGNPDLLPERMKAVELGLMYRLNKNMNAHLNLYHNNLQNGFVKENLENNYRWTNSGELTTNGAEVVLKYSSKKLKAEVNYTYTNSQDETNTMLPEISLHTANANVTWKQNKSLLFNLRANYVGKRKNPTRIMLTQNDYVDPFLLLNGAMTWNVTETFSVQFIAKNILNAEYYHTSNREPDRFRQAQRTVMISVAYQFAN